MKSGRNYGKLRYMRSGEYCHGELLWGLCQLEQDLELGLTYSIQHVVYVGRRIRQKFICSKLVQLLEWYGLVLYGD